jgi:ankyrin repeat protein
MLSGKVDTVQALLQAGYDVNFKPSADGVEPLHFALVAEDAEGMTSALLDAGAAIDARAADKDTPLIVASNMGLVAIVEMLIEASANVNAVGFEGCTALHRSIQQWEQSVSMALMAKGSNPEIPNAFGDTPFHTACAMGNIEVLQAMVKNGLITNPECINGAGQNALHCAALSGN